MSRRRSRLQGGLVVTLALRVSSFSASTVPRLGPFAPVVVARPCFVRGGGARQELSAASSEEEEDLTDVEVVEAPWMKNAADRASSMAEPVDSSAYRLPAVLWASLALDVVLNRTKRVALFGELGRQRFSLSSGCLQSSLLLASGFAVAAAVAFLLATTTDHDDEQLGLCLTAFGGLHLAAQCVPLAPWLGLSAAVINVHNVLVGCNESNKGTRSPPALLGGLLKKTLSASPSSSGVLSSVYRFAGLFLLSNIITSIGGIVSVPAVTVEAARVKALEVASLGRLVLGLGIVSALRDARSDLFHVTLTAIASLALLTGAAAFLTSAIGGYGSITKNVVTIVGLAGFSVLLGYKSVDGFMQLRRAKAATTN